MKERIFDLKGKSLGRSASDIARILMDKENPSFAKNRVFEGKIIVKNLSLAKLDSRKMAEKKYYRHSGVIGNLRESSMGELWRKDAGKFFVRMVKNMLPDNRLRNDRIKKIKIENDDEKI